MVFDIPITPLSRPSKNLWPEEKHARLTRARNLLTTNAYHRRSLLYHVAYSNSTQSILGLGIGGGWGTQSAGRTIRDLPYACATGVHRGRLGTDNTCCDSVYCNHYCTLFVQEE